MIKENTVLILGAGASFPYGYPLGTALVNQIIERLRHLRDEERHHVLTTSLLRAGNTTLAMIREFRDTLHQSGQFSIDAFLENHGRYLRMGKLAIAHTLLDAERGQHLHNAGEGRWYRYLLNEITRGSTGRLSVITFNYDRSLEKYLSTALANTYGPDSPGRYPHDIEFVHLHGSIGSQGPPDDPMDPPIEAARNIRIIHEADGLGPDFARAHALLEEAAIVAFIGFGYHPDNVRRLAVTEHYTGDRLYGTGYRLGRDEVRRSNDLFGGREVVDSIGYDALDFLASMPVFD